MTRITRIFLLLTIFFLLVACGSAQDVSSGHKVKAAEKGNLASPTALPALTASDICPAELHLTPTCLTPHAMQIAYGTNSLIQKGWTGKGQTVVDIVSFGSPTLKQDMDVFDKKFGLPPVDLQVIAPLTNIPTSDPHNDKSGWAGETTLDVQVIHAIAPGARVVVLVSPVAETEGTQGLPEFRQLEQYALDNKLGYIVSHSWGVSELTLTDSQGQAEINQWNSLLQKGTQKGMTYFSSSGDNGATDYQDVGEHQLANVPTTSFTADSPWVTSVGGTTLMRTKNTIQETAWNNSGGGFSRFYQMPDYQKYLLPAATQSQLQNHRGIPDVSADANPLTGMATYNNGNWEQAGGTSASAPIWAAIAAIGNQMAGHPLGFINPALYKIASSNTYYQDFRDITQGNNSNPAAKVWGYNAQPGWDAVTGLGTPNAEKLLPDLIAATTQK